MNRLADRLIVFDDEIEQGVEHKVFAMTEQQRSRLATLTHMGVGRRMAVAGGDNVTLAGENESLDKLQFALVANWRVNHDKQRVTEGLQLRSAVFFQGVFNGQFVQVDRKSVV